VASSAEEPLVFRGFPRLVRGFVPVGHDEIAALPRALALDAKETAERSIAVQSVPRGPNSEVRFRLPALTPPGDYRGTLRLGERAFAIVVRVDGKTHLAAIPPRIELAAGAAEEACETLMLANDGNTAATVESEYGFGLFAETGLDRAIGKAFHGEARDGHARLDTLVSAAADEYGGIASAVVSAGAGPLEAGETRAVTFAFRFSRKLRPGSSYFGYLQVANLTIPVRVRGERYDKRTEAPS
jgi:hypothetical protein